MEGTRMKLNSQHLIKEEISQKTGYYDQIQYNNQKMMQIQAQNPNDLIAKMKTASQIQQQQKIYRQNSKCFSKIIKDQKSKFNFGFQHQNSNFIVELVKLLFSLFQNSSCRPLYSQLIVLLNNIFNLDNRYMEEFLFDQRILINLRKYFQSFYHHYQNEKEKQQISKKELSRLNYELYSIIYFIGMLICQNNKKQVHITLKKSFFTQSFIKNFLSLEIDIPKKNQIYKLISIIMVFLIKKIDLNTWYTKIKSFILIHINNVTQKKAQFNFVYCLRTINLQHNFQSHQLKKYQIIPFLIQNLNNYIHQYHLTYTMDMIRLILKKNPILGYKFINLGLIEHLLKNFQSQPNLVTSIFEQLKDSIQSQTKAKLYDFFQQKLTTENLQKYVIKCLIIFYPFRGLNEIIKSFQNGLLDKISRIVKKQQSIRLWELSFSFLQVILEDMSRKGEHILSHVLCKIDCLEMIEVGEESTELLVKQMSSRFKLKYLSE